MEQSQFLLRQMIDTSLDAVININQQGIVTEWSKQAERIFGYSRQEALNSELSDLIIPPKLVEAHKRGMRHFMNTGEGPVLNKRIEITAINKEQHEFPVELTVNPIKINEEYIFSAFVRDITERKEAENALIKAKKEAEEARLSEIQFLTNISHEIRTPMNSVLGLIHLLDNSSPTGVQQSYLNDLSYAAKHLMGMINNILDYSKIKTDNLEFVEDYFSLQSLLYNVKENSQQNLKEKQVTLDCNYDQIIENYLIGDQHRIHQILTILINILVSHTQKGTVSLTTKLLDHTETQYRIQFMLKGEGTSLTKTEMVNILQHVKKARSKTFSKYGNIGLGILLVKSFVGLLQGIFRYTSDQDNQLTFLLELPLTNSGVTAEAFSPTKEGSIRKAKQLTGKKILVVEDNPMNQAFMRKLLETWDCNYELATNGLEAINKLQQQSFDLVLMDIHMPIMNGIEAAKRIRSSPDPLNRDVPIIALSAGGLKQERSQAIAVGVTDFMSKPFQPDQLFQQICHLLNIEGVEELSEAKRVTLDLSYLKASCDNDLSFVREMLVTFRENTPSDLDLLKKHLANRDLENVYRTAHKLKASLMMIGLNDQQQLAQEIEGFANSQPTDYAILDLNINQLCAEIGQAYQLIDQELMQTVELMK